MTTDRTPYDLTAVREAYSLLVDDVTHGSSPLAGIEMLRKALDDLDAAEQEATRQLVLEAIAAAVGNATTHEWTAKRSFAECVRCQTRSSRIAVATGAVPPCTPGEGCRHMLVIQRGGSSRCSGACREVYPPAAETAAVTR